MARCVTNVFSQTINNYKAVQNTTIIWTRQIEHRAANITNCHWMSLNLECRHNFSLRYTSVHSSLCYVEDLVCYVRINTFVCYNNKFTHRTSSFIFKSEIARLTRRKNKTRACRSRLSQEDTNVTVPIKSIKSLWNSEFSSLVKTLESESKLKYLVRMQMWAAQLNSVWVLIWIENYLWWIGRHILKNDLYCPCQRRLQISWLTDWTRAKANQIM